MKVLKKYFCVLLSFFVLFLSLPFSGIICASADGIVLQQKDPLWAEYPYGERTLGSSSCGLFATLNAVSYLIGHTFSMEEIYSWADYAAAHCTNNGHGSFHTVAASLATEFGYDYGFYCTQYYVFQKNLIETINGFGGIFPADEENMDKIWEKLTSELKLGRVAITLVYNHFIAIVDYDPSTDKVLVYDSAADMKKRGTTLYGDWKSKSELSYHSAEGTKYFKIRDCFTFLSSGVGTGISKLTIADTKTDDVSIDMNIINNSKKEISEVGVYIGFTADNAAKVSIPCNSDEALIKQTLNIKSLYHPLSPGTIYCVQGFVIIDNEEQKGDYYTFITKGNSHGSIDRPVIEDLKSASVKFSTVFNNKETLPVSSLGYYIGESLSNTELVYIDTDIYENVNMKFDTAESELILKPETTYYIQAFMNLYGDIYVSEIVSFKTLPEDFEHLYVSYDPNGGVGEPNVSRFMYNDIYTVPDIVPVRENFDFIGWSTSSNPNKPEFLPGDSFAIKKNFVLYAVWKEHNDEQNNPQTGTDSDIQDVNTDTSSDIPTDKYLLGDVNNDGTINLIDVVLIQDVLAQLKTFERIFKYAHLAADVNKSGDVTLVDVTLIQKYLANIITEF